MLHKCANPTCTVPFRSLREGKLFLAETCPDPTSALSMATGGSSGGVNISGCATPAPRTSRFVSTQPVGMLTVPSASGRVHASSPAPPAIRLLIVQGAPMGSPMDYAITKRSPCSVCGIDTFRRTGWFLVVENRWLDRLKILSWHSSLASQKDMKSVCCRQHLKTLIAHWLTQASLRLPPAQYPPLPIGSDPNSGRFRSRSATRWAGWSAN
jgi:hypothetical protein